MKNVLNKAIALIRRSTSILTNNSVDIQKTYHKNGKLESETSYKNCKKHGTWKQYDENGKLESETPYKNGKIHGILKWYYKSGQLLKEEMWVNNHNVNKILQK